MLRCLFVFVPAGLIMRIWHDPLRSRRASPGSTYWIERARERAKCGVDDEPVLKLQPVELRANVRNTELPEDRKEA